VHNASEPKILDMVAITIVSNWSHVCANLKTYVADLCHTLMENPLEECECDAVSLGGVPIVHGICISLRHVGRRSYYEFTTLQAAIQHRVPFTNETVWPAWAASVRLVSEAEQVPYVVMAGCFMLGLTLICVMICVIKVYRRYVGYKKLEPAKGVEPATD